MKAHRTSKNSFSPGEKGIRFSCATHGKEEIRRRDKVKTKRRRARIIKSIYHENTKESNLSQSHREDKQNNQKHD
jgi:predicted RNA-binding Zn-ribbon protein involved in translation (DUF1610 family)